MCLSALAHGDYVCFLPAQVLSFRLAPPFPYIGFSFTEGEGAEV